MTIFYYYNFLECFEINSKDFISVLKPRYNETGSMGTRNTVQYFVIILYSIYILNGTLIV